MFSPRKLKSGMGFQSECKSCRSKRERDRQKLDSYKQKRNEYNRSEPVKAKRREYLQRVTVKERRKKYTGSVNGRKKIHDSRKRWADLPGNRMMLSMHESLRRMLVNGGEYKTSFPGKTKTTRQAFVKHIESLFDKTMTWENYGYRANGYKGGWDVDHRIPKSEYNHTNEEDICRCWSMQNLRPLWHVDNLKKTNRIIPSECAKVGKEFWPLSWEGKLPLARMSSE